MTIKTCVQPGVLMGGSKQKISRIDDIDEVRPGMGESKHPEMPLWKYDSVSSLHFRDAYLCAGVFIWFHPLWLNVALFTTHVESNTQE